jgi:hypothetical protein
MDLSNNEDVNISVEEAIALLAKLKVVFSEVVDSLPECAICLMEMEEADGAVLAKCGHVFCKLCVPQFSNKKCPFCRANFAESDVVDVAQATTIASKNVPPKEDQVKE